MNKNPCCKQCRLSNNAIAFGAIHNNACECHTVVKVNQPSESERFSANYRAEDDGPKAVGNQVKEDQSNEWRVMVKVILGKWLLDSSHKSEQELLAFITSELASEKQKSYEEGQKAIYDSEPWISFAENQYQAGYIQRYEEGVKSIKDDVWEKSREIMFEAGRAAVIAELLAEIPKDVQPNANLDDDKVFFVKGYSESLDDIRALLESKKK